MQTAAQRRRLRLRATLILTLALSTLLSQAAFGQESEGPKKKGAAEQIQALVDDLTQRGNVLQKLNQQFQEDPEGAAAAMLEKEVSDRRARY